MDNKIYYFTSSATQARLHLQSSRLHHLFICQLHFFFLILFFITKVTLPPVYTTVADFGYFDQGLWFTCSQFFFIYLTYQSFDYDLTQRRLFQKHIVWNKLDIYLNISLMYGIWSFIHKICTILHILRVIQYNCKSSLYVICTKCIEHYCFVNEPSLHNDKL